jgi:hypothetical protein
MSDNLACGRTPKNNEQFWMLLVYMPNSPEIGIYRPSGCPQQKMGNSEEMLNSYDKINKQG